MRAYLGMIHGRYLVIPVNDSARTAFVNQSVSCKTPRDRESTFGACSMTFSVSWITSLMFGQLLTIGNDAAPTPPPTSITTLSGGSVVQSKPVHEDQQKQNKEARSAKSRALEDVNQPLRIASSGVIPLIPFMAFPNRIRRGLFSGRLSQSNMVSFSAPGHDRLKGAASGVKESCVAGSVSVSVRNVPFRIDSSALS